jgi:hypothetical protein
MSKKFYAVNKVNGEKWKPDDNGFYDKQYLVMYDSGKLAVVSQEFYTHISPLNTDIWEPVINEDS